MKFLFYNRDSITLLHIWKTKYEVVPFTLFNYKQKDFENVFPTIKNLHVMVEEAQHVIDTLRDSWP